ncbi:MAG: hypothetical protein V4760_12375 [Bdellovibrionota bacterium]
MNSWAKYSISFFILVLVLSALILTFGPWENREAFRAGVSPVGQLPSDATLSSQGAGVTGTTSGTTLAPVEKGGKAGQ